MNTKRTIFTPAEVTLLQQVFPTCATRTELQAAFPTRTLASLRCKAGKLGLFRDVAPMVYWTPEEDAIIAKHYPSQGSDKLAKRLNRSRQGVKSRAARLGVKCLLIGPPIRKHQPEAPTEHDPRPKAARTLKPLAVGVQAEPVKRSPATPNLNAAKDARLRQEKAKSPSVTEDIKKLRPDSEGRRIYAQVAARQGGTAATVAFREWQRQQVA